MLAAAAPAREAAAHRLNVRQRPYGRAAARRARNRAIAALLAAHVRPLMQARWHRHLDLLTLLAGQAGEQNLTITFNDVSEPN